MKVYFYSMATLVLALSSLTEASAAEEDKVSALTKLSAVSSATKKHGRPAVAPPEGRIPLSDCGSWEVPQSGAVQPPETDRLKASGKEKLARPADCPWESGVIFIDTFATNYHTGTLNQVIAYRTPHQSLGVCAGGFGCEIFTVAPAAAETVYAWGFREVATEIIENYRPPKKLDVCARSSGTFASDSPYFLQATIAVRNSVGVDVRNGDTVEVRYSDGAVHTFKITPTAGGLYLNHVGAGGGAQPKCM